MAGRGPQTLPSPIEQPVTITPYRDGPLLVRGPVTLVAPDGTPITSDRDPVALCRCGKSRLKPFCDGTHKLIKFRAPSSGELPLTGRSGIASRGD